MTPRGVDVSVTSKNGRIEHRIVELAVYQASSLSANRSRPHNQLHGGPAWIGYCPVIVNDHTKITVTLIPHGVMLHVEALSPSLVTELQETIKARAARLPGYASS